MKLHVFSSEIEFENLHISLNEAFELLEKQNSQDIVEDNFIGFTFDNDEQAVIQFVRKTKHNWILDIPTYMNHEFQGAVSTPLLLPHVFSITRDFFQKDSPLHIAFSENDFVKIMKYLKTQYALVLKIESL